MGWAALMLAAGLLAACQRAPAPQGPAPRSLAAADPVIIALQPTPKGVRAVARLSQPDLAGDTVRRSAQAVRQLARAIQAGAKDLPPSATVLTFDLYGVGVDKFGKRTPGRIFQAEFDVNDLRDADLRKLGPAGVLNLAVDLDIDAGGIGPVAAWCMRYPHVGGAFCAMAGEPG